MFTHLKTVCVHSPEVDEKGEVVDQYIHPSSRPTTDEEKKQILDEAKKDFPHCYDCKYGGYGCELKDPDSDSCPKMQWKVKWFGDST